MIEVRKLTKSYRVKSGRHYVFREVDAVFPEGANIGIIGPNGAGKSTLLRILGGIDYPDSGSIITNRSFSWPLGLKGGFVDHLSGRENCRMICNLYGLRPRQARRQLEKIKELSGIGEYFEEPVKYYSSGMSGRLGFALSMSFDFDYFLIDEITAVGDAQFKEMAKQTLVEKAKRSRVIMVSHNMGDIKKFCDVGALLKDGKFTVFKDLDAAIRAYLPQTEAAEADLAELLRQVSLEQLEIDRIQLPPELHQMVSELVSLLRSIEARLATPGHVIKGSEAEFYSLLGQVHQQLGNFTAAEEYHRKALAENDFHLRSQHAVATLASRKRDRGAEAEAITSAEKIDPNHLQTKLIRARAMARKGEWEKAVSVFKAALEKHPRHAGTWHEYAAALQHCGRTQEALDAEIKAIQHGSENDASNPHLGSFYSQLSQLLVGSGAVEQSIRAAFKSYLLPKQNPAERYSRPLKTLRGLDKKITA